MELTIANHDLCVRWSATPALSCGLPIHQSVNLSIFQSLLPATTNRLLPQIAKYFQFACVAHSFVFEFEMSKLPATTECLPFPLLLLLPPLPPLQTRQMVGKYFLIFLAACTFGHKPTDCCSCHSLAAAAFSAAASASVVATALLFFLLLKLFFQLSRCIAIETETEKST